MIKVFPDPYDYELEVIVTYDGELGMMRSRTEGHRVFATETELKQIIKDIQEGFLKIPHVWACEVKVISKTPAIRNLGDEGS